MFRQRYKLIDMTDVISIRSSSTTFNRRLELSIGDFEKNNL